MTYQEARQHFKLRDTDTINKKGVQELKRIAEGKLKVWSLTDRMRKEYETEIEACKALLQEAEKDLNQMCKGCQTNCPGTKNKLWTGCVYRTEKTKDHRRETK